MALLMIQGTDLREALQNHTLPQLLSIILLPEFCVLFFLYLSHGPFINGSLGFTGYRDSVLET